MKSSIVVYAGGSDYLKGKSSFLCFPYVVDTIGSIPDEVRIEVSDEDNGGELHYLQREDNGRIFYGKARHKIWFITYQSFGEWIEATWNLSEPTPLYIKISPEPSTV